MKKVFFKVKGKEVTTNCLPEKPCNVLGCPHCIESQRKIFNPVWIGVVGSRRRKTEEDFQTVRTTVLGLQRMYKVIVMVSGGCKDGADNFAERINEEFEDIPIIIYPADWALYGRGAGFVRNTDVAKTSEKLVACRAYDKTGGTEDTVKKFKKFHPKETVIEV